MQSVLLFQFPADTVAAAVEKIPVEPFPVLVHVCLLYTSSKDCYRFYTDIKRRKNESRTYFIDRRQEKLNERMLRDEELERMRK